MAEKMGLSCVLEHIDDNAEDQKITVAEVLEALEERGFGPILVGLALIEILPTGAIPGVPTLVGLLVILITGQMVFGRSHPWIPKGLANKHFNRKQFNKARDKILPVTNRIDAVLKPRFRFFTRGAVARAVGVVCIVLALMMPPLELIPFASSIPASAIAVLGLGLSSRDGAVVIVGLVLSAIAVGATAYWFL